MDRLIKDALTTCRKVLWRLLVQHEKGEIDLGDTRQYVDFAEREAQHAIDYIDNPNTED